MPGLDLGAFRAMFADARSMALVGSADTILDHENGERIDSHDLVVRFNRAYTEGVEAKVGRRTDILVANRRLSSRKAAPPAGTLRPRCVVCFVEPARDIDLAAWEAWAGETPTFVTLAPDLLKAEQVPRTRPVTSGTNALYTLLNLFPITRLLVTGFTFYGAAGSGPGVYWEDKPKPRGEYHDLEAEARIFVSVLERFPGELEATPEVRSLMRRYGAAPGAPPHAAGPTSLERLYTRAGWSLIRVGMALRRRAEARRRGELRRRR